jgi:RNA polymerase sigma-70 factor (ECF subfamily)
MGGSDAVPIAEVLEERRFLLGVAQGMLGSPDAAEDVVDETYRRWYALSDADRRRIDVPRSWLAKTAGGICLARLALPSGRAGDADAATDAPAPPEDAPDEETGPVLLSTLESLPPAERAAFVLRAFGMAEHTVADLVGRPEPEVAALAERARRWLTLQRSRPTTPQAQDELVRAVHAACRAGDADRLAGLLHTDVTAFFDGGGKVRALTAPVQGSRPVADSLLTLLTGPPGTTLAPHSVNGRTGLVARYGDRVAAVLSLDVADGRVAQVWVMLNPDKLRSWNAPRTAGGPGSGPAP